MPLLDARRTRRVERPCRGRHPDMGTNQTTLARNAIGNPDAEASGWRIPDRARQVRIPRRGRRPTPHRLARGPDPQWEMHASPRGEGPVIRRLARHSTLAVLRRVRQVGRCYRPLAGGSRRGGLTLTTKDALSEMAAG